MLLDLFKILENKKDEKLVKMLFFDKFYVFPSHFGLIYSKTILFIAISSFGKLELHIAMLKPQSVMV